MAGGLVSTSLPTVMIGHHINEDCYLKGLADDIQSSIHGKLLTLYSESDTKAGIFSRQADNKVLLTKNKVSGKYRNLFALVNNYVSH